MSGDWIKMRDNLWDDPRVAKIVDLTDSSEAAVIGALYWLWATADQHTHDGLMPGLTVRSIDRKTGVKGFGDALISIGWLADHPDGVMIVDFEKHNGSSAKKRCQTAKRVANHDAANAVLTQLKTKTNAVSVSSALAREEKRREEKEEGESASERTLPDPVKHPADAGPTPPFLPEFREVIDANRPDLVATAGQVWALFCEHYPPQKRGLVRWGKWVKDEKSAGLGVPAAASARADFALADPDSRVSVEAVGLARGLGRWDGMQEPFLEYKKRVRKSVVELEK